MNRILLLVLLVAALTRARGLSEPWSHGDHNGWGGAFYSNIARNYGRYGFLETRFAPVMSTGFLSPEDRRYYLTHPPGIGLALSASFRLFGEREWSARLVPLAFSLASVLLLFRLGEKVFSRDVGLIAAVLFAFAPVETLYGAHVDPQGPPVTFSALLLLLAYVERKPSLAAGALVLGALFDWPIHYLAGILAVHAWLFQKDRKKWSVGLVAASFLLGAGFLVYARFIAPSPEKQYLKATPGDSFLFWSGLRVPLDRIPGRPIEAPPLPEWFRRMGKTFLDLFTLPLLLLAAIGAFFARRKEGRAILWMLNLWGLAHILLFPLGAFVHDYWSLYLGPGLSLAAALGLVSLAGARSGKRKLALVLATTALSVFLLAAGIRQVDALPKERVVLGPKLNELTRPDEGVLLLNPIDVRDAYYADRVIHERVNRLSLFEEALKESGRFRYFVVPQQPYRERPEKPLFRVLGACCPPYAFEDYYLFDLEPLGSVAPPLTNP